MSKKNEKTEAEQAPLWEETKDACDSQSGVDTLPEGPGAGATDSGGYGSTEAQPEPIVPPTVEYGGPVIEPAEDVNYADLPEDSDGPRPNLPPEVESPEYLFEDNEEPAGAPADHDPDPFDLGGFLTLSKEEVAELVIARIKVLEQQKVEQGLRRFELMELNGHETEEFGQVESAVAMYARLQDAYQRAYTDFTADRGE